MANNSVQCALKPCKCHVIFSSSSLNVNLLMMQFYGYFLYLYHWGCNRRIKILVSFTNFLFRITSYVFSVICVFLHVYFQLTPSFPVVIVCHSNFTTLQNIIFTAQDMGMTEPENYSWLTFFDVYSNFPVNTLFYPWLVNNQTTNRETRRRRKTAFLSVKIVSKHSTTCYLNYCEYL